MYFQSSETEKASETELLSDWAVDFESKKMKLRSKGRYR